MSMNRMNREEFFAKLAGLDEERLRKVLWNLYWRGAAPVRERIEAEIAPAPPGPRARPRDEVPDPVRVREEVREFVALARAGSYLAGDRQVSPKERTRWRFTFRRLADEAQAALAAQDSRPAEDAVEALVDLACYVKSYDCFRSEDPMEAARFIVSDAVAALWGRMLTRYGAAVPAEHGMPQLVRWESRYGWTRTGFGAVSERETSLASVLARLLPDPDAWVACADEYLQALDRLAQTQPGRAKRVYDYDSSAYERKRRSGDLAEWHGMLLERLADYDAADRLTRLAAHSALAGAESLLFQARLAWRDGEADRARALVGEALTELPGHQELHTFAAEIGAPLPVRAQEAARRLSR
ncbi:hypothetical protein [Actinacidiphila soli]|uniref:hypothetical protein n=1 Tax=Actinacidiphila soli TaxID=2487275 RepID=UPI0019D31B33|nr:hypothetical protein [Actinacidiphila soli]